MLFVGDAAACLIAFVSPGSDVSCNHLGMRVCVMAVLSVPQQRGSFRLFGRFFPPPPPDSRGGKKRTNVIYLRVKSSCCFVNLV